MGNHRLESYSTAIDVTSEFQIIEENFQIDGSKDFVKRAGMKLVASSVQIIEKLFDN